MPTARRWTKTELFIALNLYHKLRFGQMHGRQPAIIDLANKLGRTSNSLAMKLCNFASLDPALKLRGIKGLAGASNLDRTVWQEFHEAPNESIPASEDELRKLFAVPSNGTIEVSPQQGIKKKVAPEITETFATVKERRGQDYFREAVLNNFGGRCGITGLDLRELLIASHILPWSTHPAERLNVRNGLALSRLHDAAFDTGLIAFDENLRLILSQRLKKKISTAAIKAYFADFAGLALSLPDDAKLPDPEFLFAHRKAFGL
jgi:putative restriction endonuclease